MGPGLHEPEEGARREPRPPGQLKTRRGLFYQLLSGLGPGPQSQVPALLPPPSFRGPKETQIPAPALPRTTGLPPEKSPLSDPSPPEIGQPCPATRKGDCEGKRVYLKGPTLLLPRSRTPSQGKSFLVRPRMLEGAHSQQA